MVCLIMEFCFIYKNKMRIRGWWGVRFRCGFSIDLYRKLLEVEGILELERNEFFF